MEAGNEAAKSSGYFAKIQTHHQLLTRIVFIMEILQNKHVWCIMS